MRYQINPHFLFNTLNSLSTLVLRQRTSDSERFIDTLERVGRDAFAEALHEPA